MADNGENVMHIDDLDKIQRLANDRTRLIDTKKRFQLMFAEGVEKAGDPVPVNISCEYSIQSSQQGTMKLWVDKYTADELVHILDRKITDLDIELGNLGIFTNDRGDSDE